MNNVHDMRDAFDTVHAMARDGKRACSAFETLDASAVVEPDTLLNVLSDIESQLRLIAKLSSKAAGLTAIDIRID